jgi:hypothetical protein
MVLHFKSKFLTLPASIRLGWKRLTVTNMLVCCGMEIIMNVKNFIAQTLNLFDSNNGSRDEPLIKRDNVA